MRTFFNILAIMLLLCGRLSAQEFSREIDSLADLAETLPDSSKGRMFNNIAWKLRSVHPEISVQYCMKAIEIGNRTNDYYILIKGYSYLGVCHRNLGNYADALEFYKIELETATKHNDSLEIAYAYTNIANFYEKSDYDKCVDYASKALNIAIARNDTAIICYSSLILGRTNRDFGYFEKARPYLDMSYNLRVKSHQPILLCLTSKRAIADWYIKQCKYDSAIVLYRECMSYDELTYTTLYTSLMTSISDIYRAQGMLDSAKHYAILARDFLKESNKLDKNQIKDAYNTLALAYLGLSDYKNAAQIYKEELDAIDSMYTKEIQSRFFTFEYSAAQYKQQIEIEELAHRQKLQDTWIVILLVALTLGIVIALVFFKMYRKLESQKKQISKSIDYAKKIQTAILPKESDFGRVFNDKFILYKPRDVVSGDFYWHHTTDTHEFIAVGDCTGHGVPGAFMSVLGTSTLHEIASRNIHTTSEILEELRKSIKANLHQKTIYDNQDGMDIALIIVDKESMEAEYSGANIPLYLIRGGQVEKIAPTHNPIGIYVKETAFKTETVKLQEGDRLYLSTDGYCSQLSASDNTKIMTADFKELLLKYHKLPMDKQCSHLDSYLQEWQGDRSQTDDVLVVGFRV